MHKEKKAVESFNRDVVVNDGYLYSTQARLSSILANRRLTEAALGITDWHGKRVIDIGCGDGTYTVELFDAVQPIEIVGIDPAHEAISSAKRKAGTRAIHFQALSAYTLPYVGDRFDIAQLRGVLHHVDRPYELLREAMRVARLVVVIEPNGYNPILKLIERFSQYHVEHQERSYSPALLNQWVSWSGGVVRSRVYAGLVPMFCPDMIARMLKHIEFAFERIPIINALSCAVYVFAAERIGGGS
jgi:ubiquinone/menaquinone biosynthesis C-methylase UbiE